MFTVIIRIQFRQRSRPQKTANYLLSQKVL